MYGKDTLYIVRVLGKERCRETYRVGEEMCACPRDKVIETYIGVRTDFRREGGVNVLVCSCLGERTTCVWGATEGVGWGWLQIMSEVSIFEGL